MGVSVILADDHPLIRRGLRGALEALPELAVVRRLPVMGDAATRRRRGFSSRPVGWGPPLARADPLRSSLSCSSTHLGITCDGQLWAIIVQGPGRFFSASRWRLGRRPGPHWGAPVFSQPPADGSAAFP